VVAGLRGGRVAVHSVSSCLSGREREVLQLVAEGQTSGEIAAALHLATRTVEQHRRRIMDKIGLHTVADLTKFAIRNGIIFLEM
jgi:DNA-binding CsgD family transcriptional regulator